MIYMQLFLSFLKIGLFSFGGGYATLPLIEEELVNTHGFLQYQEFIDLLTIAEITPGPIAVNAATFAGNRVAGILGGTIATLGVVAPAITIVLALGYLFRKYGNLRLVQGFIAGLRPASVALIASAAVTLVLTALFSTTSFPVDLASFNWIAFLLFGVSLYFLQRYNINTLCIILFTGIVGGIIYGII